MKILVAYFSATGTTGVVATELAKAIEADVYEIVPEVPYSNEDLNWRDENSRSSVEMKDDSSRPAIGSAKIEDMDQYEIVFLGFPVWWYIAPHIINTFLESYNFSGKKIVLFATSGGSGIGETAEKLRPSALGAQIFKGEILNGTKTEEYLKKFAENYIMYDRTQAAMKQLEEDGYNLKN